MKILVVEDDDNSRVLLTSVLNGSGYEALEAANGIEAIAALEQNSPDMIISDILMPEMDGYALCQHLKSDDRFYQIPFVFYTATYTEPQDKKFALDLGAAAFWIKPMEMDHLILELENLIKDTGAAVQEEKPHSLLESKSLDFDYKKILSRKLDKKVRDLDIERQKLKASENRYKRIVEALREDYFFYTHDMDGNITYVSPSISVILGYSAEQFSTHYGSFMTDSPVNETAHSCKRMVMEGKKQPAYEIEMRRQDGSVCQFEITEEPLYDEDGRIVSVEGIARDITRQRTLEARIRKIHKMEALGTLAGGIAHDFNNILFSIMANANMIITKTKHTSDTRIFESADMILKAGRRAGSLTRQVLTYLRKGDDEKKEIQVQVIIDEVFKLVRPAISKTITFELDIDSRSRSIMANPSQLHQVIMNLCTNAAHAIGEKIGEIRVSLKEKEIQDPESEILPGMYLELIVSDTGKGIDPDHLERIFDPYFTTKAQGEGTGLGLSMVHGIITGLNGHITVESEPDNGATFTAYLPVL